MRKNSINHSAFQAELNKKKLMATQCQNCQAVVLPPRPICVDCYSDQLEWLQVTEEGQLAAFTIIHIAPTAMIEAGYGRENPYCAGIVRLENGQMISAQILDVDIEKPENIKIGTQLTVSFIEREEGDQINTYLAYRPSGDS